MGGHCSATLYQTCTRFVLQVAGSVGDLPGCVALDSRKMLSLLKQVAAAPPKKAAALHYIKPARQQMLGGMWDSDVQSRWRDDCSGFCGARDPHRAGII